MKNEIISLESNTAALKAQRLLNSNGISATLTKTVDNSGKGCMGGLRVNGDKDKICKLLSSAGIRCR